VKCGRSGAESRRGACKTMIRRGGARSPAQLQQAKPVSALGSTEDAPRLRKAAFSPRRAVLLAWAVCLVGGFMSLSPTVSIDLSRKATHRENVARLFSSDYVEARKRFRSAAREVGADVLRAIAAGDEDYSGLYTDVAVFRGSGRKILVHLCGTHGVEGFAGSAIQLAVLKDILAGRRRSKGDPTVVLVHAVNPYGFATLRRVNEHNIDLNRNFLRPEEISQRLKVDPGRSKYDNADWLLNPNYAPSWMEIPVAKVLYQVLVQGASNLKQAVVTGNYHKPQGIYYGGSAIEPSLRNLNDTLAELLGGRKGLKRVHEAILIDVHSGLGPSGYDTYSVPDAHVEYASQVFYEDNTSGSHVTGWAGGAMSGYEDSIGDVVSGLGASLFRHAEIALPVCHEFGTLSSLQVLLALRHENAVTQNAPWKRWNAGIRLRDAFYLHSSHAWKQSIVSRGKHSFSRAFEHLSLGDY